MFYVLCAYNIHMQHETGQLQLRTVVVPLIASLHLAYCICIYSAATLQLQPKVRGVLSNVVFLFRRHCYMFSSSSWYRPRRIFAFLSIPAISVGLRVEVSGSSSLLMLLGCNGCEGGPKRSRCFFADGSIFWSSLLLCCALFSTLIGVMMNGFAASEACLAESPEVLPNKLCLCCWYTEWRCILLSEF